MEEELYLINSKMREHLGLIHVENFPSQWEASILNLLPKKCRKRHPVLLQLLLNEMKETYMKEMQEFSMKLILFSTDEDYNFILKENAECAQKRQTRNYNNFTKNRKLIANKYSHYLEPIRITINMAQNNLPDVICDFKNYHQLGIITLDDLRKMVASDIRKGSSLIGHKFYIDIAKAISKTKILREVSLRRLSDMMRCITNVFVQQILNIMIKSIDHLIRIMDDEFCRPRIKLRLILQDGRLHLDPSIEEISLSCHEIIENIRNIAQDLTPFEEWLHLRTNRKHIKIQLSDWFVEESHNKLQSILDKLYQPVKTHIQEITEEFQAICATNVKRRLSPIEGSNFELSMRDVQKYDVYLRKSYAMVANVYYSAGKLEQDEAKESLKRRAFAVRNVFVQRLVSYHERYNESICEEFEEIQRKALNVPKNAKTLIELTEYISNVSKVSMHELKEKIRGSIRMLSKLLDITILTEKHVEQNRRTINWRYNIEPVFLQNNALCEAMKNELEDDMQRRINLLNSQVDDIIPQLCVLDDMDDIKRIPEYVEYYKTFLKQVNHIDREMRAINEEETLFRFPETEFPRVIEAKEIILPFYTLIYTIRQWQRNNAVWLDGPFEWLDAAVIETKTLKYFDEITEMSKTFKSRIKMDVTANKCFKFSGIADDPDPMQQPVPLKLCYQALNDINDFKTYLPLVICMCNPALRDRHWKDMSGICDFDLTPNAGSSLRKFIAFDLMGDIGKYEAISISANRELAFQRQLSDMIQKWDNMSFEMCLQSESNLVVFINLNDIELLLEEHLVIIEEMMTSSFVKSVIVEVTNFLESLTRIREIINLWNHVQGSKLDLDSIFSGPNIEKCLLKETNLFAEVKGILSDIQSRISNGPSLKDFNDPSILLSLNDANEKLEETRKRVKDYLESKRLCFPRFFFLSDYEIQKLLFETQDVSKLSVSLKKAFPGVQNIKLNRAGCVSSIFGACHEELRLNNSIPIYDNLESEKWLIELDKEILNTVKENIRNYNYLFNEGFIRENLINFPSMAIICASQIHWAAKVQNSLSPYNRNSLISLNEGCRHYLSRLTNELSHHSTRKYRNIISSLIITFIHQSEIIQLLLDRNIASVTNFEWVSQLKYYVDNDAVKVSIFNSTIKYGYEYNYYKQCLVTTTLTDRCFHTMIQTYKYHLYGAIIGSSTTGKTETIRSLGKALAMQFHVFNCDNGMSYSFLCRILKGYVACGAWLCLESFDRINLQVLSAITAKLVYVSQMVSTDLKTIAIDGVSLSLKTSGHICAIMNSGRFGYSKLPHNLKSLFRTVSMMAPDVERIAEVGLYAVGFSNAKVLALKLQVLFKLLAEQLWCESCNYFDLSSVKAVVKTASYLKRNFPDENESMLMIRSIIDVNIAKLCEVDVTTFKDILHDLFPDVTLLPPNCGMFLETVQDACQKRSLSTHDTFVLKIIQLFELMYINQAIIIVGNPFAGKTEILGTLRDVLLSMQKKEEDVDANIKLEIIIPGVVNSEQLYGHFDNKSKFWKDGLLSKLFRCFAEDSSADKKWIVFDGPINNAWFESLNTVLDSNRLLHLNSGETIHFAKSMSMVFETMDIAEVSPSILSRCGIIYIESNSIDWRPYVKSHVLNQSLYKEHRETLFSLFDWVIDPCMKFLENCSSTINVEKLHIIMSTLNLFEMYLKDAFDENAEEKETLSHFVIWAQVALIIAIIWGFGGNLNADSHIQFNSFCLSLWSGGIQEHPKPDSVKHFEIILPQEGLIRDYFYIFKGVGIWKNWGDILKAEKITAVLDFNNVFVPTVDTLKYSSIFLKHVRHRKPFLLSGKAAVGKTTLIKNILKRQLSEDSYLFNCISSTSLSSAKKIQQILLSKLNKIRTRHYGPPKDQLCVNFIDDFNIEIHSEFNGTFEVIRQHLNYGYLYDANEPEKLFLSDVLFIIAITISESNSEMCKRFLRHFNVYAISEPATENVFRIFSNVLFANLKRNLFAADVLSSVTSITNSTINVYNSIIKELRPTPSKFQYCFNVRDMSRVISGCSLLQKESVETKVTFIRLWVHETCRVFGDRMSDKDDKEWLFQKIRETVKSNFKDSFETAFDYLPKFEGNKITKESFDDLIFWNNVDDKLNKNNRYEEISSMDTLRNKVLNYITDYNNHFKKQIDIVASKYMLECLIRIARILAMPGSNLLMISSMGFGKKSISKLAAFMQQQRIFEPSVYSYSDLNIWKEDMRIVLEECGALRKDVLLYLSGNQMKDELLQDILSFLSVGEMPDLFSHDYRQRIIGMVRLHAQGGNRNAEIDIRSVMNYFVEQCKNKLHMVIHFKPTDGKLKRYLSNNSNLVKHCTINWYDNWPEEALTEIGKKRIQDINIPVNVKPDVITACVKLYHDIEETNKKYYQNTGRTTHITASSYLHMLRLYSRLISQKQEDIVATRKRYLAGLEKLELAAQQVEEMKRTLTILKPQLERSAQQTMITMKEVETENVTVERATILMKEEEEVANRKAAIAATLRGECEADLAVAIPILEDAVAALNTLKPTDITLVKAMKNPPDTVKLVMAAVCVMLEVPADKTIDPVTGKKYTDYWGPSKRILGDMNFLQNLKEYDKDDIPTSVMQVIKKTYMTDKSFMPHIVAKASSAAEGLCKWVRAMVSYDDVAKVVAPKKEKLNAAQRECDEAEAYLNEKRRTLSALNMKLAGLNDSLQETLQQKLKLEREVENCTNKLNKAEKLIASLGGEKSRWMQCAEDLKKNYDNLVGDMILSCGIIAYMAHYNISFRDQVLRDWKKCIGDLNLSYSEDYNFINALGVEGELNHWHFSGLPKSRFSTENAIIMNNSELWCLFVDSQNQANQWIKKIEQKNELKVIKITDPDYMSVVQFNAENGKPVLIENTGEHIDTLLDPFLYKNIYKDNGDWYLDTGRNIIKYTRDFRLYITSRHLNPRYSRDIFNKLTIIDFSIPNEALQDKLLDIVISKEKSELQEKFEELVIQDANNKKILKQQEDNILITLSSTTSNILEDENAIRILDSSKTLSLDVMKKQKAANSMTLEINKFRESYIQFAKHSAGLFDTLNALSCLNHMYRFSFSWFIQLYLKSIETSNRSVVLEKRLSFLKSSFTQNLHSSVCRSLSEKHRILYSFLLTSKMLIDDQQATEDEVKYFMSPDLNDFEVNPTSKPDWLPCNIWRNICNVANKLSTFSGILDDFRNNEKAWETFYNSEPLRDELMPKTWSKKLTHFQKLVLVKMIRPDKIFVKIMELITSTMGEWPNYSPQMKISESYAESSCLTPLIFILPSSSSTLSLLSSFASRKGHSSRLFSISMGEDQEDQAKFRVQKAQREGGWIFLQNCHLVPRWLVELESICENSKASSISLDFRLWISSDSTKEFPISILQNSIKISHDTPLNYKQSLLNIYQSEPIKTKEFYDGCPGKDKEFSRFLFGICFFHVVAMERAYFGIQGWNVPYELDYCDLQISITELRDLINNISNIDVLQIDEILYHVGECNYGGKMLDEFDRKTLRSLLNFYCNASTIMDQQCKLFIEPGSLFPKRCEYHNVIKHIQTLPIELKAEMFGSNENGVIIRDSNISAEFLTCMYNMSQISFAETESTVQVQVLIKIRDIQNKLPDYCKLEESRGKYNSKDLGPMDKVLLRESKMLIRLLKTIKDTLTRLESAFDGSVMFSDTLREVSSEIYNDLVPQIWRRLHVDVVTESLPSYTDNIMRRVNYITKCTKNENIRSVYFDTLFFPKMLLSAVLLTFSKQNNIPVEEVVFDFQVANETSPNEKGDGYFICGLHLTGAGWDSEGNKLTKCFTNKFWQEMPPIRLKCSQKIKQSSENYDCPVYIEPRRSVTRSIESDNNYVVSIPLKTDVDCKYWIKCGVALFCKTL